MADNLTEQLAYFEHLATSSKDIGHTESKPCFFAFDFLDFLAKQKKGDTILFLHQYQGAYDDNRSDNPVDTARVQWSILRQVNGKKFNDAARVAAETKLIAEKILARMEWHKTEDENHTYCDLLRYYNLDDVEYRVDEIYEDNWTGYRVITPMSGDANLEMNPDDWN